MVSCWTEHSMAMVDVFLLNRYLVELNSGNINLLNQICWTIVWIEFVDQNWRKNSNIKLNWFECRSWLAQYLLEEPFNPDFYMRCRITITWGNLPDGIQRRIDLPRFNFVHFYIKKTRQDVWQCLILQSWFEKSLDACVLEGDVECQVPSHFSLIGILLWQIFSEFCHNILSWVFADFGLTAFFPRPVLAFRNFRWVTFVGQTGKNI